MNLFNNLSIGKKLLIVLLLVSILPLWAVTCGFYRLGRGKLTEQTIHTLEVQEKNVSATVNSYIDFKFKHAYKLFNIPQLIHILNTRGEIQPRGVSHIVSSLRAKLRIDPDFLSILLLDSEGHVVLSTGDITCENYAVRPFFYETVKGRRYVSAPCVDGDMSCIYFGMPIMYENKICGVAVLQCRAEELWELIENEAERVGLGNAVIVSDSDGVRIAHSTKRDLIFKSWMPLKPEIREQILKEMRYGSNITGIPSTDIPAVMDAVTSVLPPDYFQHRLIIGTGTYHSVIKVMDNGWRIMSTIPEATFLEPIRNTVFYISILSGIISCVVIVASIVIGQLSTRRIHTFALISEEVAKGNYIREIPFVNGDEIGQLGKAFNTMTASVRKRIEQLKYLNDVALEIHSHINLEKLLQDVINIAKKLMNAEIGALVLLDEQGEKIKHFAVATPNPLEPCRITEQPTGRGLLGVVMKKGVTIRSDNVTEERHSVGVPDNHPPIRTLLGVPLKINQRTVGGLFLANKTKGEKFTLEDEELLLTISYQAAVAIENTKLYGEVQQLAVTDGLTGLLNHREFHKRLDAAIEGSKRYKYAVSLLMIDIDHFKQFNDTYGHQVGDIVLKIVSDLVKGQTRVVDVCARYGGEEFAVILMETDTPYAAVLSERIRSTIFAYPFKHDGMKSQLSVSIGVATFPHDTNNAEDLIKRADESLYRAKDGGRNKVCCYHSDQNKPEI